MASRSLAILWGVSTVKSLPNINLVVLGIRSATGVTAHKQVGHPFACKSNSLVKYPTGDCVGSVLESELLMLSHVFHRYKNKKSVQWGGSKQVLEAVSF